MKNITVSVPDEVYRRARVLAAERSTSVSALVREHLESLLAAGSSFERRQALQNRLFEKVAGVDATRRLTRDELHNRRALR